MIPAEAVEAAAKAVYGGDHFDGSPHREAWLHDFRIALEAAVPFMHREVMGIADELEASGTVRGYVIATRLRQAMAPRE